MLALIKNNEFIETVYVGGMRSFDDFTIMSATDGWSRDDYSLHSIQPAEPVPDGKIVTATTVELVSSVWTYVNTLSDIPILTPQELHEQMPDKTPREFRDILTDMGIFPQMVTDKINQIPFDIERQKALNAWEVMTSASRVDPYIDMIGAMFDKTPEQIDEAWVSGS